MPKMKTRRAAAKRYKLTATGKIKIKKTQLRHILTNKSRDQKRGFRKAAYVHPADVKRIMKCLPYGA